VAFCAALQKFARVDHLIEDLFMLKQHKQSFLNLRTLNAVSLTRRNRLAGSAPLEAKVMLASRTITISGNVKATPKKLKKWQNALHLKGSGTIDLQGKTLTMNNASGGSITGLRFTNGQIVIQNSNNFKLQNNTITNSNQKVNIRAIAVRNSSSVTISGNKVSGRLKNGITVNSGSGHNISNNTLSRQSGTPGAGKGGNTALGEDHGIYVLNKVSNTTISGNRTSGWSTKPSGHGLKLKDISNVRVSGNTFNSGIIIRTNPKRNGIFSNVSFTNNRGKGGINADARTKKLGRGNKASGNSIGKVDIK
jgi:parallel beta-helix repeat protein